MTRDDKPILGPGAIRVEALRYRSLRYISQRLGRFQVLVGPNASGKSNFLDVLAFLGDVLRSDLETATVGNEWLEIPLRATDARKLSWMGEGDSFELAVEMAIPPNKQRPLPTLSHLQDGSSICRYEVEVEISGTPRFLAETVWLLPAKPIRPVERALFPMPLEPPLHIVKQPGKNAPPGWKRVVSRSEMPDRVMFSDEKTKWRNHFRISTGESALASLPADEDRFPVALWLRRALRRVQRIVLSSEAMRRPSPPVRQQSYLPDGSSLPHVVKHLEDSYPEHHRRWIEHIREALPDIASITTFEREEDRHRYLVLKYKNGLAAPSWLVSDGTLRLLALTLLAYLPNIVGIYLIEEPENGVHPRALENMFQSLSSVYSAQILLTTHSPLITRLTKLDQLLCLARSEQEGTDIVTGSQHPVLQDWQGVADLGTLLASGVLG